MNFRRLGFWTVIFGVLLLYVLLFEQQDTGRQEKPQEETQKIFLLEREEIKTVHITRGDKKIAVTRKDKNWAVTSPPNAQANQEIIASLITALVDAVVIEIIEENPVSVEQYGLTDPEMIVSVFHERTSTPITLLIGKESPTGVSMYAMLPEDHKVILVGTFLRFSLRTFVNRF